jgi:hypothetical protein
MSSLRDVATDLLDLDTYSKRMRFERDGTIIEVDVRLCDAAAVAELDRESGWNVDRIAPDRVLALRLVS